MAGRTDIFAAPDPADPAQGILTPGNSFDTL
jgi:hypothetical protein